MTNRASPHHLCVVSPAFRCTVDEHKGRICIGRVSSGSVRVSEQIVIVKPGASQVHRMIYFALAKFGPAFFSLGEHRPACVAVALSLHVVA